MEESRDKAAGDSLEKIQKNLGLFLVGTGIIVAFWVLLNMYQLFNEPGKLKPFQEIITGRLSALLDSDKEHVSITISPEFLSLTVPVLFLFIGVSISSICISGGVKLLTGSSRDVVRKFSDLKNRLEREITVIKNKIDEKRGGKS